MKLPKEIADRFPVDYMDDTFVREEVIETCNKHLDDMVARVQKEKLDYRTDNDGLVDLIDEFFPMATMTEEDFGYVIQTLLAKCVMCDLVMSGCAEEVEPNVWKMHLPEKNV